MASTSVYNIAKGVQFRGVNWLDVDVRALLIQNGDASTFNSDHDTIAQVLAAGHGTEWAGSGYSRQTVSTSGRAIVIDDSADRAYAQGPTIAFGTLAPNSTNKITHMLLFFGSGTADDGTVLTDMPIMCVSLGSITPNTTPFTVAHSPTSGYVYLT